MTALILLSDWQKSQIEFWRQVVGLKGYDVSSFGRVRSYWILTANKGRGKGFRAEISNVPQILNPSCDSSGYPYLNATSRKVAGMRCPKVHRLVALVFLPNPDELPEVNHKTALKRDCRLDNLEWVTRAQNIKHMIASGLKDGKMPTGEAHYRCRISDADILEMIRLYDEESVCLRKLAGMFDTSYYFAWDVTHGRGRAKKLKEQYHGSTS